MDTIVLVLIGAAALVAVGFPLLRARRPMAAPGAYSSVFSATDRGASSAPVARYADDAAIDAAVERYRVALRAGTICDRCRQANPPESRFCADCGHGIRVD